MLILKELKINYIFERTKFWNIFEWTKEYKLKNIYKDLRFEKTNNNEIQGSLVYLFYRGNNPEEFLEEKRKERLLLILNFCKKKKKIRDFNSIYLLDGLTS